MDKKEKTRTGRNAARTVSIADFHKMLVLSKWALGIFDGASFEPISQALKTPGLEGLDEESGHTRFYNPLVGTNLFCLGEWCKGLSLYAIMVASR